MIKFSVLYPNRPGTHFDMSYYVTHHMPLAMRLLSRGLRKTEADAGLQGAAPGEPPTFRSTPMSHPSFNSTRSFIGPRVAARSD